MANLKRTLKTVDTGYTVSKYDLEGSRESVIAAINDVFDRAEKRYGGTGYELYLDWSPVMYSDDDQLTLYCKRPETDSEYAARIGDVEAQLLLERKRELALLAELKAKYEQ